MIRAMTSQVGVSPEGSCVARGRRVLCISCRSGVPEGIIGVREACCKDRAHLTVFTRRKELGPVSSEDGLELSVDHLVRGLHQ